MSKKTAMEVIERLKEAFPDAHCELDFTNPYELLVATMLSAQCTDVRVNMTTKTLFPKYPTVYDLAAAPISEIEEAIKEVGLFRTKAKNLRSMAKLLISEFGGEVPGTMEELTSLPGVGRKTANVVLSNAFGVPAIAVDTHVFRVSNRIGLSNSSTPEACEADLKKKLDKSCWSLAHHLLIFQGRRICKARKPLCGECSVADLCRYADKTATF